MESSPAQSLSELFKALSSPARMEILLVIAGGEACVCHLEAYLGLRQAAISQHLMALREAGLVEAQRSGRNIYYRLARPALLSLLEQAAAINSLDPALFLARPPFAPCPCPHCNPSAEDLDCSATRVIP